MHEPRTIRPSAERLRRLLSRVPWHVVGPVLSVALFLGALAVLAHILQRVSPDDVVAAFEGTPDSALALGMLCTFGSYLALAGYDGLALRQVGVRGIGLGTAAVGSFTSYAISYTLGFPLLTAAAVRYRVYGSAGLSGPQIAALTLVCTLTFWLGMGSVLGLGFLFVPGAIGTVDHLPDGFNQLIGLAILAVVSCYTAWVSWRRRVVTIQGWSLHLPGGVVTAGQILLGMVDACFAAAAFYVILPDAGVPPFATFAVTFVFAAILGSMSHAPGGIGVFEATMLIALPDIPRDQLLGSILLFRVLYYFVPFALALAILGVYEAAQRRHVLAALADRGSGIMKPLAPFLVGGAVFLVGMAVLVTGAVPIGPGRRVLLAETMPLPVVEAANLLAAVAGVVLLFLARGLFRRLERAWLAAGLALGLVTLAVVLRGIDLRFATVSALVMAVLLVSRPAFGRQVPFFNGSVAPWWMAAIATVLIATVGAALFSIHAADLRAADLDAGILVQASYADNLSRILRSTAAAVATALVMTGLSYYRRWPTGEAIPPLPPDRDDLAQRSPDPRARLILLKDKTVLGGEGAALMLARRGQCSIALGDPIVDPAGDSAAAPDLFWAFREAAEREGLRPVVLLAGSGRRALYVEAGMAITHLGDRARLDLTALPAEPLPDAAQTLAWADAEALSVDLVPAGASGPLLAALRAVSDRWLAGGHREGFFALGRFEPGWIVQNGCAVLRQAGAVVGFAVLLAAEGGRQVGLDILRLDPELGPQALDFLLLRILRLSAARGARSFDFGLTPALDPATEAFAPTRREMTSLLFPLGDHIGDLAALRAFKLRFAPTLSPAFLASPGGFSLPQAMLDVTALIEHGPDAGPGARIALAPPSRPPEDGPIPEPEPPR